MEADQLDSFLEGLPPAEIALLAQSLEDESTLDGIWERCSEDIWLFLTTYVKTINQHREETVLGGQPKTTIDPFPRMPHHEQIVEAYWKPDNVLIEKSRDMMLTWTMCAIFLWDLMFTEGVPMMMTTYREYLVDDGGSKSTPNSLLGRMRFMYEELPDWMKQRAPLEFKFGHISNPVTRSFVVGFKGSEHTSRSGKYYRLFADEFAHFERSEATLAAMTPACPTGLCLGSTPGRTGVYNGFGRIATTDPDNTGRVAGFRKITLHWSTHPDRDRLWYEKETEKLKAEDIAREYDISYEGAIEARVWPFNREVHVDPDLEYDPDLPLYLSFDHGLNEETIIFWQIRQWADEDTGKRRIERRIVDEYQGGIPEFGVKMTPWENVVELKKRLTSEPYNFQLDDEDKITGLAGCLGDPSGSRDEIPVQSRKTDDTKLTSWHEVYQQHGFYIQSKFSKIKDGIIIVTDWLKDDPPTLQVAAHCRTVIEAMINHRHKKDPETGKVMDRVVEDWTKHWCDSVRYFAINTSSVRENKAPKERKYREVWTTGPTGARSCRYVEVG